MLAAARFPQNTADHPCLVEDHETLDLFTADDHLADRPLRGQVREERVAVGHFVPRLTQVYDCFGYLRNVEDEYFFVAELPNPEVISDVSLELVFREQFLGNPKLPLKVRGKVPVMQQRIFCRLHNDTVHGRGDPHLAQLRFVLEFEDKRQKEAVLRDAIATVAFGRRRSASIFIVAQEHLIRHYLLIALTH